MRLRLRHNLPFVSITAAYRGKVTDIPNVLIDTGSAKTILATDTVHSIGVIPENQDMPRIIRGVGGTELVFTRSMDYLKVGESVLSDFEIEIGGMDYGFEINGIMGMDFLIQTGAVINLKQMIIELLQSSED